MASKLALPGYTWYPEMPHHTTHWNLVALGEGVARPQQGPEPARAGAGHQLHHWPECDSVTGWMMPHRYPGSKPWSLWLPGTATETLQGIRWWSSGKDSALPCGAVQPKKKQTRLCRCDWVKDFGMGRLIGLENELSFLAMTHSMWDLSSPTRDHTHAPNWKLGVLTNGLPGKSLQICSNNSKWSGLFLRALILISQPGRCTSTWKSILHCNVNHRVLFKQMHCRQHHNIMRSCCG